MRTRADGSSQRRGRAMLEVAASAFLVWHVAAITIGPASVSHLAGGLPDLPFKPYLELFHLDPPWGFLARDPTDSRQVRARIEYHRGLQYESGIVEPRARLDPAYLRYAGLSSALSPTEPGFVVSAAHWICRQHRAAPPARVTFVLVRPSRRAPDAYEPGHRLFEPDVIERRRLDPVYCP